MYRFPVYDMIEKTGILEEGCSVRFQELLNDYLTQLGCTARELSAVSGISAPVISRYRSGSHSPDLAQCRKLAAGVAALA